MNKIITICTIVILITSCGPSQQRKPTSTDNICYIFADKSNWRKHTKKTEKKWGVPRSVVMAIIKQESNFNAKAKPPHKKLFWFVPHWRRTSSAYGYPQATDSTWKAYKEDAVRMWFASRSSFADAADFIGWHVDQTYHKNGVAKHDAYNQYLAYHEGQDNYAKESYKKKQWLLKRANKVKALAKKYANQLKICPR